MRAAFLLSPSFITQDRTGARKAALILMKYSHFDRRALYIGIYRMILVFQFANDFDINSGENQKSSSDDSDLTMSLQVSAIHKLFKTRLKSALRARPRCAQMESRSGLTSSTPMVRTHTLDPTPDAPRS